MLKADLIDLHDALQEAKEGSPELDETCLRAVGWEQKMVEVTFGSDTLVWFNNKAVGVPDRYLPKPSRNTQDALDWMVPDGLEGMIALYDDGSAKVTVGKNLLSDYGFTATVPRKQLARGLCIAAIEQLIGECDD